MRMTPDRNLNAFWLRCILEEVLTTGVQDAVLCPGGRSIALCLAIAQHPAFRHAIPYTDERSASFLALGLARSSGRPVVIVTTSGSAVANLVPALTEAQALHVPLILLTCDRPRYLRNAGYSQMTDHIGACQAFVAANVDLPDPQPDEEAVFLLRERVSAAVAHAIDPATRGIVHINIPLEGMYDSTETPAGWRMPPMSSLAATGRKSAVGGYAPMRPFPQAQPDHAAIDTLRRALDLRPGLRGLIVAGPECPLSNEEVDLFSRAVGFPVLADAASGFRRADAAHLVTPFDALAVMPGVRTAPPQLVIRLGLETTLVIVQHYLLENPCAAIKITAQPATRDYLHPGCAQLVRPARQDLAALAAVLGPGDAAWLDCWQRTCRDTARRRQRIVAGLPWGELKAASIICNADNVDFMHLANSMSIRNGDLCAEPSRRRQRVFSNRGVNGIDGTLGTFIGELIGTQQAGLLLLGDLAFIHDLTALAFRDSKLVNGCICVMNNGGGAIFDLLPASVLPGYASTIRNTSSIDIEAAARCFRLPYRLAEDAAQLTSALQQSLAAGGLQIVEVRVPSGSLAEDTIRIFTQIRDAVAA